MERRRSGAGGLGRSADAPRQSRLGFPVPRPLPNSDEAKSAGIESSQSRKEGGERGGIDYPPKGRGWKAQLKLVAWLDWAFRASALALLKLRRIQEQSI